MLRDRNLSYLKMNKTAVTIWETDGVFLQMLRDTSATYFCIIISLVVNYLWRLKWDTPYKHRFETLLKCFDSSMKCKRSNNGLALAITRDKNKLMIHVISSY